MENLQCTSAQDLAMVVSEEPVQPIQLTRPTRLEPIYNMLCVGSMLTYTAFCDHFIYEGPNS